MRNKKILFISIFILMIVLSIGAVSAQDADDAVASTNEKLFWKILNLLFQGLFQGEWMS